MAVDAGDIRAGAAHVEGDDLRDAETPRRIGRADGAAGRTAEEHVLRANVFGRLQTAGAGHDLHVRGDAADAIEKGLHRGVQVSVRHGALRARQQLGKGGGLMGEREMREAALTQDFRDSHFVLGMRVAMHQGHSGGRDAFGETIQRGSPDGGFIQRLEGVSIHTDALRDLAGEFVKNRTRRMLQGEEIGPALIADVQQITEALRDEKRDATAFALQQGVRSASGGDAQTQLRKSAARRRVGEDAGTEHGCLLSGGDLDQCAGRPGCEPVERDRALACVEGGDGACFVTTRWLNAEPGEKAVGKRWKSRQPEMAAGVGLQDRPQQPGGEHFAAGFAPLGIKCVAVRKGTAGVGCDSPLHGALGVSPAVPRSMSATQRSSLKAS